MSVLLLTIATLVSAHLCWAGTWSINATHPDYPGKCFYGEVVYDPGEISTKGTCDRLICSANGWLSKHNCIKGSLEGCARGERIDPKRPFPDCCRRLYTCHHGDGTKYTVEDF